MNISTTIEYWEIRTYMKDEAKRDVLTINLTAAKRKQIIKYNSVLSILIVLFYLWHCSLITTFNLCFIFNI